jgi:hypothetical protein
MNLKNKVSHVNKTPLYLKNSVLLGKSVAAYWWHYFGNRRFPGNQEFYVVYTNIDHSIPFHPDSALDYWLINLKFIPASMRLGDETSGEFFNKIRRAYVDIAREGSLAFREVPTIMPHFTEHRERALQVVQTFMKPINCCPSLHTAAPFFIYNLGLKLFPREEAELRRHVGDVISTVIKTKLHAIIDVAFGMFLARRIINNELGLDFHLLEDFFTQEQKTKDKIPYEYIYKIFRDICEVENTKEGKGGKLPTIMERYFQEIGLPRVGREKSNCLYDLEQNKLVYSHELEVGKGLL